MFNQSNKPIHPGYIISQILEREDMTQKNLSERTGLTEKHLSQIINAEASVTVETSLLLENALGGAASFWINLEKNYQETKSRLEKSILLKKEIPLLIKFPYKELAEREYVEQTKDKEKKVENLWKFFGVNSLLFLPHTEPTAFRATAKGQLKSEMIAAWLRCGEIEAKKIVLPVFSESVLKDSLGELKSLTVKPAEEFSKKAQEVLNRAGVALIYTQHFSGSGVSGAVRWIGDTPLMQLSLLGAYADMFWFTFFHEIGHLILHGKKDKFLEFDSRNRHLLDAKKKENEADDFATSELIDKEKFSKFIKQADFSKQSIQRFSKEIVIDPGIVAGRLCHEGKIKWPTVASLRRRLKFVPDR